DQHPYRREFFIIDRLSENPSLGLVLADVLDSIDAFLGEGRQVVVHCHVGQSRTGFVLRAWLMRHNGWDEPMARQHLEPRWPHLLAWNDDFTQFLTNEFDLRRRV